MDLASQEQASIQFKEVHNQYDKLSNKIGDLALGILIGLPIWILEMITSWIFWISGGTNLPEFLGPIIFFGPIILLLLLFFKKRRYISYGLAISLLFFIIYYLNT